MILLAASAARFGQLRPAAALASRRPRPRRGFTLVEMLVVVAIIGVLIAIAVPVLGRARESARGVQCQANLRQFHQGFSQYMDTHDRMCSGAFDWQRDGCPTEVGWVADLVTLSVPVGDMLCPSSPAQLSNQYQVMLTADPTTFKCSEPLGKPQTTAPDGTILRNVCRQIAAAPAGGRAALLTELMWKQKYNTNYATSWFLVRGEADIDPASGSLKQKKPGCDVSVRSRHSTQGPIMKARIGTMTATANVIPLMGDAGTPAAATERMLSEKIGPHEPATILAENFTYGPVEKTTLRSPSFTAGGGGPSGRGAWWGVWNATLQDYRAFGPMHGGPKQGSCNILFLDGTVKPFTDGNGDGLLNNGFPAGPTGGFADDTIELPAELIYSGWSLDPTRTER